MNTHASPSKLIKGATGDWEVVIGLEVHAQVTSQVEAVLRRLDRVRRRAEQPCLAGRCRHAGHAAGDQRGMRRAGGAHRARAEGADQSALGVRPQELFLSRSAAGLSDQPVQDRRSSARARSCVDVRRPSRSSVGIERLHLEQDAGKSLHDQSPTMSFVDLNRSGVALMEIVSKPDMRSAEEAKAYVTKLRTILRYLGTCDGNMEKGSLRADVNVSVRQPGAPARHALRDQERQFDPLHRPGDRVRGAPPDRHHRGWRRRSSRRRGCSIPTRARRARCAPRKKRMTIAISPIPICCRSNSTQAYVDGAEGRICRNCRMRRRRASSPNIGLPPYDAGVLVADKETADYYEAAVSCRRRHARPEAGRQLGHRRLLRPTPTRTACQSRRRHLKPAQIGALVDLIARRHDLRQDRQGPVSRSSSARTKDGDPRAIVETRGMKQVTDSRRHRDGGRCHHRRQSGQGRAGAGQAYDDRLVRRPGDEADRRQGQSASRQ